MNFTIIYKEGKVNWRADALPRLTIYFNKEKSDEDRVVTNIKRYSQNISMDKIKNETERDTILKLISNYIENGWKISEITPEIKNFYTSNDQLSLAN